MLQSTTSLDSGHIIRHKGFVLFPEFNIMNIDLRIKLLFFVKDPQHEHELLGCENTDIRTPVIDANHVTT